MRVQAIRAGAAIPLKADTKGRRCRAIDPPMKRRSAPAGKIVDGRTLVERFKAGRIAEVRPIPVRSGLTNWQGLRKEE